MGEGGDHVLDGVADGVGVLVVHPPGVAHKAVGLLLMDRLCMFRPQRKKFCSITPSLYRDTGLLVCSASVNARQMFWRALTHSHSSTSQCCSV